MIQLAGVKDPAVAAKLIGKTAVLQFYDFEADLTGPSVNTLQNQPIAVGSLFDLLSAPQTIALADKGTPSQWYLFDNKKVPQAGPKPTKKALLESDVVQKNHAGKVPDTMAEMLTLPGVARKTANVVLGNAYGVVEGIAVDTHVGRLARRLGLTAEKDPDKVERDLMGLVPRKQWFHLTYLFIEHGRKVCKAPVPRCEECVLSDICPSSRV